MCCYLMIVQYTCHPLEKLSQKGGGGGKHSYDVKAKKADHTAFVQFNNISITNWNLLK
jgi:hypothetical protein